MFPREAPVLVIDDVSGVRMLTIKSLRSIGFSRIGQAGNGKEALKALTDGFEGTPFGLILVDVRMPDMDGLVFLAELKKNPEWANTPTIMVSAESDKETIRKAIQLGVSDYIIKPLNVDLLVQKLDRIAEG